MTTERNHLVLKLTALKEGDILELLKFVWLAAPQKMKAAFGKVGLKLTGDEMLLNLANLHLEGQDRKGIKMENGTISAFDVRKVAESIELNKAEVMRALSHAEEQELEQFNPKTITDA